MQAGFYGQDITSFRMAMPLANNVYKGKNIRMEVKPLAVPLVTLKRMGYSNRRPCRVSILFTKL